MNIHIATIKDDNKEFYAVTDVSIFKEPEAWRLIISEKIEYLTSDDYDAPRFDRLEVLLVDDYFERFTVGDFRFLLQGIGVNHKFKSKELLELLPKFKDGKQTIQKIDSDVFHDKNKDKWISFGITDQIRRKSDIAESMYRIEKMEQILDELDSRMSAIENKTLSKVQIDEYLRFQDKVKELEKYYTGPEWKIDLELDEKGEFPSYLKRGVLSEDGIYNALEKNGELLSELK